jgi:hypothetical protein
LLGVKKREYDGGSELLGLLGLMGVSSNRVRQVSAGDR